MGVLSVTPVGYSSIEGNGSGVSRVGYIRDEAQFDRAFSDDPLLPARPLGVDFGVYDIVFVRAPVAYGERLLLDKVERAGMVLLISASRAPLYPDNRNRSDDSGVCFAAIEKQDSAVASVMLNQNTITITNLNYSDPDVVAVQKQMLETNSVTHLKECLALEKRRVAIIRDKLDRLSGPFLKP